MKELWLLRHAKSSWKDASLQDFDRPLKGRGRRNAATVGRYLSREGFRPDAVICSPALRTCQTLEKIMDVCKWPRNQINFDPRVYEAAWSALRAVIAERFQQVNSLLLIGHNPGLEMLLQFLVVQCPSFADGKILPTGAFAQIRLNGDLSSRQHQLVQLIQPRALDPDTLEIIDAERTFFDMVCK